MGKYHPSNAWHCAIISLISLLGIFYFSVVFAQVLLFLCFKLGSPTLQALSVIAFCASVILWCSLILLDQVLSIFQNGQYTASRRSEFELGAVLAVIWTSTLPTVLHLFETQPSIQLGYAAILTIAFFVTVAELLTFDSR
ncbi:Hly-III-related protein [Penicillium verhagenii]|uniref:Hly-III-related protein n=1 Tax=Penicillium verhagenii TaxID=1562060 RepID=UPI0025456C12|nr:Hly-III-related protein [Penicillium verhagenii]KAJ5938485.1 Hly-III-related protein [Penicillium verhagenii]